MRKPPTLLYLCFLTIFLCSCTGRTHGDIIQVEGGYRANFLAVPPWNPFRTYRLAPTYLYLKGDALIHGPETIMEVYTEDDLSEGDFSHGYIIIQPTLDAFEVRILRKSEGENPEPFYFNGRYKDRKLIEK